MAGMYLTFDVGWVAIVAIPLFIWIFLAIYRKSYKNPKEIKQQLIFGVIGIGLALFTELLGVSMGLWHYGGGDWPIILWVVYFLCSVSGYQMIKTIEKIK